MVTILIGHRGVGKTALLNRLEQYFTENGERPVTVDLDQYIEKMESQTVAAIFSQDGETQFRRLEEKYFADLVDSFSTSSVPVFIAVGAGFQASIPAKCMIVWLRRETDRNGRIFLDRPRLRPAISAWAEAMELFNEREAKYRQLADWVYTLPEGLQEGHFRENLLFSQQIEYLDGILTVLPDLLRDPNKSSLLLQRRRDWGLRYFELRDDILTADQIDWLLSQLDHKYILFSCRQPPQSPRSSLIEKIQALGLAWDWPVEFGPCPYGEPTVASLHTREDGQTISQCIERLQSQAGKTSHLKLAVPVDNFNDLLVGHQWAHADLNRCSFLPTSAEGRWRWYRLLNKGHYKLNFLREGVSTFSDQPYLLEWLAAAPCLMHFGAVVGDPVIHSRTPIEHEIFFAERGLGIFPVRVTEQDWASGALTFLRELGMSHAAITSPLKGMAFKECKKRSQMAENCRSINTIVWDRQSQNWQGHCTDWVGLQELLKDVKGERLAVWGGGGTREVIKQVVPKAVLFSARSGKSLSGPVDPSFEPEIVIWAVGRTRFLQGAQMPPAGWHPKLIIDLNYTADSPGLEYALQVEAEYRSGLMMFKKQAEAQRTFWRQFD